MLDLGKRQQHFEIPSSRFSYYCIKQKVTKVEVIWALFFNTIHTIAMPTDSFSPAVAVMLITNKN